MEFLNGETESTSLACQLANPRATIYTDKLSPMQGALYCMALHNTRLLAPTGALYVTMGQCSGNYNIG